MPADQAVAARRGAARAEIVAGGIDSLRTLGTRLRDQGHAVTPDELRADLREIGAIKVEGPDGPVYAVAVPTGTDVAVPAPAAALLADPDWPVQVAVVAVVVVFLALGLLGWVLSA